MKLIHKARTLIADDHSIVVAGVRKVIEEQCEIVGTVEDGRLLVETAKQLNPDLIILDISMPFLNGVDAARQLRHSMPSTKLLFLTMHASKRYAIESFKAGGRGYVLKHNAATELPLAIRIVLEGRYYLTPTIGGLVIDQVVSEGEGQIIETPSDKLTIRQREILQLIGEGKETKDIAALLNVSVKTVHFHKTCIMQQLKLSSTAELTHYAIVQGLKAGNN